MCSLDECGTSGRRTFLKGALAAGLMLPAAVTAETAPQGSEIDFPGIVGSVHGYLARPRGRGRHPAVLVSHAVVGLPAWVRSVADELAAAGFVALATSFLSRFPSVTDEQLRHEGRESRFLTETAFHETQQEQLGAIAYLNRLPYVRPDRIGAVGFCGGGIQAVRLSPVAPALRAIVSFYGPPALPAQYKHPTDPIHDLVEMGGDVRAPLQIHYGTADYAVRTPDVERLVGEVRAAGTEVEVYSYEGATHAFYDNRGPAANEAAARLAHDRYLHFLHAHLG